MTQAPDGSGARYRAAVIRFAEQLTAAGPKPVRPDGDPGTPVHWLYEVPALDGAAPDAALSPLCAAAERALVLYPGPVGELLHREIHAYLEIGHRFGGDALIHRLAAHLSPPQYRIPHRRSPLMAEHDLESLARASIEAFNRSDWTWPVEHCGEPFLYEETGTGTRLASAAELVAGLQAWKAAIPDGTGEVTRAVVAGDTVVMEVVWRGTQTGPMATGAGVLPPSGLPFETWATIWARFVDGKIVHERHHMDLLTMLAQIGALPAPASA